MNDRAASQATTPDAKTPRQHMRRLRRHLLPLQSESMSPIDLPSVRTGLLTKLNALTVGLIALTAIAISAYYFWQQWSNEGRELRQRGRTIATVLAEQAEFGVYTSDRKAVGQVLATLGDDRDVAYAIVLDRRMVPIVERRFLKSLEGASVPPLPATLGLPAPGRLLELQPTIAGRRYLNPAVIHGLVILNLRRACPELAEGISCRRVWVALRTRSFASSG